MKRIVIIISAIIAMATSASAMSYEQARDQALFLTDKMAYELNLTEDQYEAAYEINLDYLMSIDTYDDLYGTYWTRRNLDLSYILMNWQYRYFCNASYFYRPLYWDGGYWHFGIYARYPHRNYFYYGCPHFVTVYRGGHSWYHNNNRSYYRGRTYGMRDGRQLNGMRDDFNNGRFGRGQKLNLSSNMPNNSNNANGSRGNFGGSRSNGSSVNSNSSFGNRQSSTRTTVGNSNGNGSNSSSFGGSRSSNRISNSDVPNSTFAPKNSSTSQSSGSRSSYGGSSSSNNSSSYSPSSNSSSRSSFGGSRSSSSSSRGSFGNTRNSSSSNISNSRSSNSSSLGSSRSSMGSSRSSSVSSSRSSSPSRSSSSGGRSFGGGRR